MVFNRILHFFSSIGMMLLGILLLIGGTISIEKIQEQHPKIVLFPQAEIAKSRSFSVQKTAFSESSFFHPVSKGTTTTPQFQLSAHSVIVVDDKTDAILFTKNENDAWPLASVTKLMSALILVEQDFDFSTTTAVLSSDIEGDQHLIRGEVLSLEELWNAALVASSNAAINALIRKNNFLEEDFVKKMNDKAKKLQMSSLQFFEPTGLDNRNKGNAKDVAQLLKIALFNKKIYKTLQQPYYQINPLEKKPRVLSSTNAFLVKAIEHTFLNENIVGKTGYIPEAGYNFVSRIEDNRGHALRIVILGSSTADNRFAEARDLAKWTFENYIWPDDKEYHNFAK